MLRTFDLNEEEFNACKRWLKLGRAGHYCPTVDFPAPGRKWPPWYWRNGYGEFVDVNASEMVY